jgi:hypothetical protein
MNDAMPGNADLEPFLEMLVEALGRRLGEQDKAIKRLEKAVKELSGAQRPQVDQSVLRVLRGT